MCKEHQKINIFIPGRVSLIGELSDWTCEYKFDNQDIIVGRVITSKIDKGIYATACQSETLKFHMGEYNFECAMDEELLDEEAKSDSFYSYICGVTLHMLRKYNIKGISVDVVYNTLPMKKGLASSAAICSVFVKAFNDLYSLNLSENELMNDAYFGERLALSCCGRLDQIVLKREDSLFKMIFHEDCVSISSINVKKEMNLVIVDLMASKDTKKILSSLRSCYPFAKNSKQKKVRAMLEEQNYLLVEEMQQAIEEGNLEKVGSLFVQSQAEIDQAGIPICSEYKAPILHSILEDEYIQKLSYGARGIGAGGDGSAQILAKDKTSQQKILKYLNKTLQMEAFAYNIKPTHKIKKAIIPLAGVGARLYPVSRAIKKAFLPINDQGVLKPIILKLVEELDAAGIEEICLVIGKDEQEQYDSLFKKPLSEDYLRKLDSNEFDYDFNLLRIGSKISYVIQEELKGFGHAVYLCKDFVKEDPVLMILGDTYYDSNIDETCIMQIVNYYDNNPKNIIAINEIDADKLGTVGVMTGIWDDNDQKSMTVKQLVEKPTLEYAKQNLQMNKKYYGNFGMWVIDNRVFESLGYAIENKIISKSGEYEFVDALARILDDVEVKALKINGVSHDIGNLNAYQNTLISTVKK